MLATKCCFLPPDALLGLCRSHLQLLLVFGYFCSLHWFVIHLHCEALFDSICSISLIGLYTSESTLLLLSAATSQWSESTGSRTCPCHNTASTMLDASCCISFSRLPIILVFISRDTFLSELLQALLDVSWQSLKISPSSSWVQPCCEPCVLPFINGPFDCRLWQWYVLLLERSWLNHGKNSAIIQFSCLLRSVRPRSVAELASAFILFKGVPNC